MNRTYKRTPDPGENRKEGETMKDFLQELDSVKAATITSKRNLKAAEALSIMNQKGEDTFGMITLAFKLGFLRGEKYGRNNRR